MPNDHANQRRERAHQRVWELLPWHQTARLEPAEAKLVEEHLAECDRCRAELAHGRALARVLREDAATVPSPHPGGFARLLARVDELGAAPPARTAPAAEIRKWRARVAQLRRTTPRPVRRLLLGQMAALLALALALAWRADPRAGSPEPGVFRTLSSGVESPSQQPAVRVVFAPDMTESEIRSLLAETGGQIAGGPSPMGAYLVRLPSANAEPLSLILSHLRSHPKVRFAEPVAGATTPAAAAGAAATNGGSGN